MRKTVKSNKKPSGNQQDPIFYVFTLIPAEPPERAIRLRRQIMAIYSYCLLWAGTIIGVELSAFAPDTPHLAIFSVLFAINLVFFLLIRSGLSERLGDPSLTILQMATGIILTTVILHYTRELRGAMLSIYFMVMTSAFLPWIAAGKWPWPGLPFSALPLCRFMNGRRRLNKRSFRF